MKPLFATLLQSACKAFALPMQDLGLSTGSRPDGSPAGSVQRGATGLPVAWRLFPFGQITITRDGEDLAGEFTQAMADSAVAFAAKKGVPVPIDAEHALFELAQGLGVEEAALANVLPSGALAVGYGTLAKREDGLWLTDVQWTDVGQKLVRAGGFRYFSPVLRGNVDRRWRITSIALTNNPAINGLDAIAAQADDTMERDMVSLSDLTRAIPPKKKEQPVKDLLDLLGAILGSDAIALNADGEAPASVIAGLTALKAELPALRQGKTATDAFLAAVREPLALSGDPSLSIVQGSILGLAEKAAGADTLKARVDALELTAETRTKAELTAQGLAEGKLSKAMTETPWFKGQNAAALSEFLKVQSKIVPTGGTVDRDTLTDGDAVALTDEDRAVIAAVGITEEAFLAAKKGK